MDTEPLACAVWMVTYNHEHFIAKAIESVLSQKTKYSFRIYLGEDRSTDNTARICENFASRFPDKIVLVKSEMNMGAKANGIRTYNACFASGAKYMALLEGDDFWNDINKLERQLNFLESNPDYSVCFHAVHRLDEKSGIRMLSERNPSPKDETYSITDLAAGNFIYTSSVVYRNNVFKKLPERFSADTAVCDYVLHMLNAYHGKIKYFAEPMATYRLHGGGIWSTAPKVQRLYDWIGVMDLLIQEFKNDISITEILKSQRQGSINAAAKIIYSSNRTDEIEKFVARGEEYRNAFYDKSNRVIASEKPVRKNIFKRLIGKIRGK